MQNITTSAREVYPRPLDGESHDAWAERTGIEVEDAVWNEIQDALEWDGQCQGHPAGEFDLMGQTVYCDGSCRR